MCNAGYQHFIIPVVFRIPAPKYASDAAVCLQWSSVKLIKLFYNSYFRQVYKLHKLRLQIAEGMKQKERGTINNIPLRKRDLRSSNKGVR